jgi:hypothetical protein
VKFLGEFKDDHLHGVLLVWWDAHHTSVRAHFMRWCRSAYMDAQFLVSLQQPCGCACLWSLSSNRFIRVTSWSMPNQVTFMAKSFPSGIRMRNFSATSGDCSFDGIVLSAIPKSYLDASHTILGLFITLNESFQCGSSISHILAQLTKIWLHEPCAE